MYLKGDNKLEILSLYTKGYGRRYYLREISRISGLPLKTVQNALKSLEKEGIIKGVVEGKNKYFSLNLDNIETKLILLQAEIYKTTLFLEKYIQIRTFLKGLEDNESIMIFGSFARLSARKDSDIDMLVVQKRGELPLHLLPNKPHEISMSERDFLDALRNGENLMKEMEENHIILNNHSFFVDSFWRLYAGKG